MGLGAKVASDNGDGTFTVNWDAGYADFRTVNAGDIFRPQDPDPPDAYRLHGLNAYDIGRERKNIAAGLALEPSSRTNIKEIYDGRTLFPPSMLTESQWQGKRGNLRFEDM